jgi:hypothetical protein
VEKKFVLHLINDSQVVGKKRVYENESLRCEVRSICKANFHVVQVYRQISPSNLTVPFFSLMLQIYNGTFFLLFSMICD